jgi:hypothetical protein
MRPSSLKLTNRVIAATAFLSAASTFAVFALFFGERGEVLRIV